MKAFHGDEEIKKKYLNRVHQHFIADEIIKGKYWEKGKGCAVGCTIHSSNHKDYEKELGIPMVLAKLEDGIFENLPMDLAKTWPERFLSSINTGADLSQVWSKFAVWLLINKKYGVVQFCNTKEQKKAIFAVAKAYKLQLRGSLLSGEEWLALRRAAADADAAAYAAAAADADAADAAYAAAAAADAAYAAAAAADAAYAAAAAAAADADAAAYAAAAAADAAYAAYAAAAAADAAYAAAAAAAAYAAYAAAADKRIEWRIAQSEKLLKLLRETRCEKVIQEGMK